MNAEQSVLDEYYSDGYDDGMEDALSAIMDDADLADEQVIEVTRAVRKQQGWCSCVACKGTGERQPTERDFLIGLLALAGAQIPTFTLNCYYCGGIGFVSSYSAVRPPKKVAA